MTFILLFCYFLQDGGALAEFFKRWKFMTEALDDFNEADVDDEPIDTTLFQRISVNSIRKSKKSD